MTFDSASALVLLRSATWSIRPSLFRAPSFITVSVLFGSLIVHLIDLDQRPDRVETRRSGDLVDLVPRFVADIASCTPDERPIPTMELPTRGAMTRTVF